MLSKVEILKTDIVVKQDVADQALIDRVVKIFEDRALSNPTAAYSNDGCYREFLGDIDDSSVKKLLDVMILSVQEIVQDMGLECSEIKAWCNVNKPESYNEVHTHPMSLVSGCFYLSAEGTGDLTFVHPANQMMLAMVSDPTVMNASLEPINNSVVVFPSWYPHRVETNKSDKNRVNIAFSIS